MLSRLKWFGHVEQKHDNDWFRRCKMWEVEVIRHERTPKKTWWEICVKNDMESLSLSQKDVQFCSSGINGEGELRGQPANPGSPGKWPLKRSVCVKCDIVASCITA